MQRLDLLYRKALACPLTLAGVRTVLKGDEPIMYPVPIDLFSLGHSAVEGYSVIRASRKGMIR
jgi:hypothetical protein